MNPERLDNALDLARDARGARLIARCEVGPDAPARAAAFVREIGSRALLVGDANTLAAGAAFVAALEDRGVSLTRHTFGADPFDATDALGDAVAAAAEDAQADVLVAVGSGTVCDLAKHAGSRLGRPAVLCATAASMNGYTSGITALKVRGLKRTLPCTPARAVFATPEILANAPQRMTAAGLADFLSKPSASADWRAAGFLRGESFDPQALRFYDGTVAPVLEAAPRVGAGDPDATALVMQALLLSGLSMLVAGSSSPASGGEHLLSHYLDMKAALFGLPHDLHGAQVGVGTVHCLDLWQRLLAVDPAILAPDRLADSHPTPARVEEAVREDWPEPVAGEVLEQWRQKAPSRDEVAAEVARFTRDRERLAADVRSDLLPAATVANAIRAAGGPTEPDGLDAPAVEFRRACRRARFIRSRYTVLDLAAEVFPAECGLDAP